MVSKPLREIEEWREREYQYEELRRQGRWAEAGDAKYENWGRDTDVSYEDWCSRG